MPCLSSGSAASPGTRGAWPCSPSRKVQRPFWPLIPPAPHTSSNAGNMSAARGACPSRGLKTRRPGREQVPAAVRPRSAQEHPGRCAPTLAEQGRPRGRSASLAAAFRSRVRIPCVSGFPRSTASFEIKSPPPSLNRRGLTQLPPRGLKTADRPAPGLQEYCTD